MFLFLSLFLFVLYRIDSYWMDAVYFHCVRYIGNIRRSLLCVFERMRFLATALYPLWWYFHFTHKLLLLSFSLTKISSFVIILLSFFSFGQKRTRDRSKLRRWWWCFCCHQVRHVFGNTIVILFFEALIRQCWIYDGKRARRRMEQLLCLLNSCASLCLAIKKESCNKRCEQRIFTFVRNYMRSNTDFHFFSLFLLFLLHFYYFERFFSLSLYFSVAFKG